VGQLFHGGLKKVVKIFIGLKILLNLMGLKIISFLIGPKLDYI
jgi:hypothetical protein